VADFVQLIDLAAERLGGRALWASDEFFAPKENLLRPGRGTFIPDKYTDHGKWMDGWESRRRRTPGNDSCIIQLGLTGFIRGVDVDTNHFRGNAPQACSLEACRFSGYQSTEALIAPGVRWVEILPRSPLEPDAQNLFPIANPEPWSHVRLQIYPDGGVARFRVYGVVVPDWDRILSEHRVIDLAAVENGGSVLGASDEFFSDRRNLIMPGRPLNMGDGWETRRRRGPGHDWVVVKLGRPGTLKRIQVDTTHFKGNFPESCSLEGCLATDANASVHSLSESWKEILPRSQLQAHTQHTFDRQLLPIGPVSHVRLHIYPDGGVARLRLFGEPAAK
jgi:allantoicase